VAQEAAYHDHAGLTAYTLKISVLEDALLGFAETFGFQPVREPRGGSSRRVARREA
jgi:hypothetical protein